MKKIWTMRKNDSAVSPVIATILMVAITVVLAAVLYVMVLGLGTTSTTTPVIGMTKASTATTWTFTMASIGAGAQVLKSDVYVIVKNQDGTTVNVSSLALVTTGNVPNAALVTAGVTYSPVTANSVNYLSVGDSIILKKATATDGYAIGSTLTLVTGSGGGQYYTGSVSG